MSAVSLHESAVQTTWSLQSTAIPWSHWPVVRLQVSTPLQKRPSSHVSVWLQACAPVSRVSSVQAMPSSQSALVLQQPGWGSKWHVPVIGSQLSSVQTSLSLQTTSGASWHWPVAVLQVSTPVQRSPSEHCASVLQQCGMGSLTQAPWPSLAMGSQVLVVQTTPSSQLGAATTVWHMPPSQASSPLQNWPSSQRIGVPAHTSLLQTSPVVHGFRSSHGAVLSGCVQAPSPSHWSSVQTSPSSVHGVSAAVWQSWAASLHVLLHSGPLAHGSPLCLQTPPLQVSVPLQNRPSLQAVPLAAAGLEHWPVAGSHVPASWHWSEAVQVTGLLPTQLPPWQLSLCVQALLSLQAVPLAAAGFVHWPVAGSHVPASWHWSEAVQVTGLLPTQLPPWQLSLCVQALASLQAAPSAFAGSEQVPVAGSQVPASWH